jgi:nitric oxide reductase activation protein
VPTVPSTPSTPVAAGTAVAVAVRVDEGYAVYTQKRADIDALLERDPTILNRSEQANALYRSFLERGSDAENDVFNDFGKGKRSQALNPMYDKAKKAKVYERTRAVVDKLHGVLFGP